MSCNRNKRRIRLIAAAALLATTSVAAADVLVVRSTGPSAKSFPPGKKLPEQQAITLKAGDQLVVLDGRGTRTLHGPGNVTLGAAGGAGRNAAAAPVSRGRARIAAVRGPEKPSLWDVDASKSSTYCIARPNNVKIWRPGDELGAATITLTGAGGQAEKLQWTAGVSKMDWPSRWPASDGAEFRLAGTGAAPTLIRFKILPEEPRGWESLASTFIANGCTAQLDFLIATIQLAGENPPH